MDLLLSILKFSGIIVGGISGVLGTLTRTHDEKTIPSLIIGGEPRTERTLTRWGKTSLTLTVMGALVATGSQLAENLKQHKEDAASRKRTEEQILQANRMLGELSIQSHRTDATLREMARANTVIDQIKIIIRAEVSDANEGARLLLEAKRAESAAESPGAKLPGSVFSMTGPGNQLPDQKRLPRSNLRKALLTFLERPPIAIELRKRGSKGYSTEANLLLAPDSFEPPTSLAYNFTERTLSTFWEWTSSRERWQSDGEVISIPDMDQAQLTLRFSQRPGDDNTPVGLTISRAHLRPGSFSEITLTNFVRTSNEHTISFQATLPAAQELFRVSNRPLRTSGDRPRTNSAPKR